MTCSGSLSKNSQSALWLYPWSVYGPKSAHWILTLPASVHAICLYRFLAWTLEFWTYVSRALVLLWLAVFKIPAYPLLRGVTAAWTMSSWCPTVNLCLCTTTTQLCANTFLVVLPYGFKRITFFQTFHVAKKEVRWASHSGFGYRKHRGIFSKARASWISRRHGNTTSDV